jgi:antitoxin component YwqK of YwqJK toxin-antitoxin module
MKKLLFFAGILMILNACTSEKVNFSQLQDRNGLFYLVNKDKPFTGEVASYVNGKVEFEGKVEKGLREGLWVYYYPSGQKKAEGNYKDGLKDGNWTSYNENGTQDALEVFKYGKSLTNQGNVSESAQKDSLNADPAKEKVDAPGTQPPPTSTKKVEKKQEVVVWERLRGGPVKYLNGVPYTGAVVKYQRNGLKELEGNFYHGQRSGKWVYYNKFGNVRDVRYY